MNNLMHKVAELLEVMSDAQRRAMFANRFNMVGKGSDWVSGLGKYKTASVSYKKTDKQKKSHEQWNKTSQRLADAAKKRKLERKASGKPSRDMFRKTVNGKKETFREKYLRLKARRDAAKSKR